MPCPANLGSLGEVVILALHIMTLAPLLSGQITTLGVVQPIWEVPP